ncbi:hypothetical protein BHE74_00026304 [Ensete ventricosum]|nr:hypothetical protein BHE74_00026304 [Ensete ventricosum]
MLYGISFMFHRFHTPIWLIRYRGKWRHPLTCGVGKAGETPVDAVGVVGGVGLLLRGQQLPLPERVHRRVRVLPELRHRRDTHERHRQPHRPDDPLLLREQPPVRADRHPPRRVRHWHRLHRALDPVRVAPVLTPVAITRVTGEKPGGGKIRAAEPTSYQVIHSLPVLAVLGDRVGDDAVPDAVDLGVIGVGFHQERRPVELHCGIVLLRRFNSHQRLAPVPVRDSHEFWLRIRATSARKTLREAFLVRVFLPPGMADWTRHTIDSHWFLLSESPTNMSRFPLSLSSMTFASNLYRQPK